jgi:hypothetical protein
MKNRKNRENRELRALDRVITLAYYVACVVTAAWLVVVPALRFLPGDLIDRSFTVDVPVAVTELTTTAVAEWEERTATYPLNDVHGDVEIPITVAPITLLFITWLVWGLICGLATMMLYQARKLVRRVRAGAPFDAENAIILRRLGSLLLVQYVVKVFYGFGVSTWVVSKLDSSSVRLSTAPFANWSVLLSALVLMVLAEIFRRGAALEHEQSLVV